MGHKREQMSIDSHFFISYQGFCKSLGNKQDGIFYVLLNHSWKLLPELFASVFAPQIWVKGRKGKLIIPYQILA